MRDWGRSTGFVRRGLLVAFSCGQVLAGCVTDLSPGGAQASYATSSETPADSAPVVASAEPTPERSRRADAATEIDQALVPDPSAFAIELDAVWDGLPTLQGVWIAHPLASRARRVRLTNEETGAQVDAALFRRDPNQGGPTTMISSEAAEKLGIEPGAETPITIVAISHADQIMLPTGSVSTDSRTVGADGPPDGASGALLAGAAVEGVEAAAVSTREAGSASEEASDGMVAMATPVDAGEAARMPAAASNKSGIDADSVSGAGTTAPLTAPAAPPRLVAGFAAAAVSTGAAEPAPQPEASSRTVTGEVLADGLPYIQAGIFGAPGNAERLVTLLRESGLPTEARSFTAGERTLTRVLVGPFHTSAERDEALATVRSVGPADATPVKG